MARLIYSAIMSLDGYVADADGRFEWAAPDEEVHAFVNELERPVGAYLYGRRMYETMRYWDTAHTLPDQSAASLDFARIWQAADKIVYSATLRRRRRHPRPARPGPPEPGPGRGAQVRRRHRLPLLPPGLGSAQSVTATMAIDTRSPARS